jgi:hypothetical protein
MWFHKKHLDKFFIQKSISVLKKYILLKKYFHLKDDNNYVGGLCIKSILYVYQNARWNQRKPTPKIYQNMPKKSTFVLPKMVLNAIMVTHTTTSVTNAWCSMLLKM